MGEKKGEKKLIKKITGCAEKKIWRRESLGTQE